MKHPDKTSQGMDMLHGPLLGKLLLFALPLIFSGVLQLLFNAADVVVVGRFAGSDALAAVGSTGALINLLTNLFIGLAVGTNVLVAKFVGAGEPEEASQTVHTSVVLGALCGVLLTAVGVVFARPILLLMGTPDDVVDLSALYLRIYFLGMPAMLLYNFGSAALRAVGDTKRPLVFLSVAGVINIGLNLFFVICLKMSVAGVAIATVISETVSAVLLLRCLARMEGPCRLTLRGLRVHRDKLRRILEIGLPAGLQGTIFSVSNVLIQSSINSFGSVAMAGNAAAQNLEGFLDATLHAYHLADVSFTSQNYGAGQTKRIPAILTRCLGCSVVTGIVLGVAAYSFGTPLLSVYNSDPEVIAYGLVRMKYLCLPYFTCGIMDVLVGSIRGMGRSVTPMITSLVGACLFRIIWIFTVFSWQHTLPCLYVSYPISWVLTLSAHFVCYCLIYKKVRRASLPAA